MNDCIEGANSTSRYRISHRRGPRIHLNPHSNSPDPSDRDRVHAWLESRPRPWAIDLFCGAGGLSLGLEDGGFSVVAAADSDPVATETHAANIEGLTWTGDLSDPSAFIRQLDDWGIEDVDLLAGGPPCQPFSTAGMSKIGNLVRRGDRRPFDARADLWRSFFAIVDRLNPRAMLFENVPNFAQAQGGAPLIALVNDLERRGYGVHVEVLEAWRYRVPQHRSRLFVIGIAGNDRFEWPKPVGRRPTVGQAIRDLPVAQADVRDEIQVYEGPPRSVLARLLRKGLRGSEAQLIRDHVTRSVRPDDAEIYGLMEPGDTYMDVPEHLRRYRSDIFSDKYLRLSFEDLSRTITAHIAKDGYWYIQDGRGVASQERPGQAEGLAAHVCEDARGDALGRASPLELMDLVTDKQVEEALHPVLDVVGQRIAGRAGPVGLPQGGVAACAGVLAAVQVDVGQRHAVLPEGLRRLVVGPLRQAPGTLGLRRLPLPVTPALGGGEAPVAGAVRRGGGDRRKPARRARLGQDPIPAHASHALGRGGRPRRGGPRSRRPGGRVRERVRGSLRRVSRP